MGKQFRKMPTKVSSGIFLFPNCLTFGEGTIPLGNMPSRYTRNYLPMLYKTFRAYPLIPLFWASTNVYQMQHGGFIISSSPPINMKIWII